MSSRALVGLFVVLSISSYAADELTNLSADIRVLSDSSTLNIFTRAKQWKSLGSKVGIFTIIPDKNSGSNFTIKEFREGQESQSLKQVVEADVMGKFQLDRPLIGDFTENSGEYRWTRRASIRIANHLSIEQFEYSPFWAGETTKVLIAIDGNAAKPAVFENWLILPVEWAEGLPVAIGLLKSIDKSADIRKIESNNIVIKTTQLLEILNRSTDSADLREPLFNLRGFDLGACILPLLRCSMPLVDKKELVKDCIERYKTDEDSCYWILLSLGIFSIDTLHNEDKVKDEIEKIINLGFSSNRIEVLRRTLRLNSN